MAGPSALAFLNERDSVVRELQGQLKVAAADLPSKVTGTASVKSFQLRYKSSSISTPFTSAKLERVYAVFVLEHFLHGETKSAPSPL